MEKQFLHTVRKENRTNKTETMQRIGRRDIFLPELIQQFLAPEQRLTGSPQSRLDAYQRRIQQAQEQQRRQTLDVLMSHGVHFRSPDFLHLRRAIVQTVAPEPVAIAYQDFIDRVMPMVHGTGFFYKVHLIIGAAFPALDMVAILHGREMVFGLSVGGRIMRVDVVPLPRYYRLKQDIPPSRPSIESLLSQSPPVKKGKVSAETKKKREKEARKKALKRL